MIEFIKKIIRWIINFFDIDISDSNSSPSPSNEYSKKEFLTKTEYDFYLKLLALEPDYRIIPQVNLATIIKKNNGGYINELFKNIDFAIFDKDLKEVLLLIELNDFSHNKANRKDRDLRVKKICNDSGIKLITFYATYPNEKQYVVNRIKNEINNINTEKNNIN